MSAIKPIDRFRREMRMIMAERDITQTKMASQMGVNRNVMSQCMNGSARVSESFFDAIVTTYKLSEQCARDLHDIIQEVNGQIVNPRSNKFKYKMGYEAFRSQLLAKFKASDVSHSAQADGFQALIEGMTEEQSD